MDAICSQRLRCLTEFSAIAYCCALETLKKFVVLPIAMTKVSYFSVRAGNNSMPSSSCAAASVMVFALLSSAIHSPNWNSKPCLRAIFKLMGEWIHTARSHFMQQRFPDVYGIAVGKYDFGFFAFSKPVAQP